MDDLEISTSQLKKQENNPSSKLSFQQHTYFNATENFALWEGRVNTTHLQSLFGIGRQKASDVLGQYRQFHPENLVYDSSLKGYKPTGQFKGHYISGHIDDYSRLLSRANNTDYLPVFETGFSYLEAPLRNISPELIQPIIRAIREEQRLDIGYTSLSSPEYESRIISPHCLVFDGIRWHVRAYCGKNQDYRDFVLSRFNGEAVFEGAATQTRQQDKKWNTLLDLVIQPDPRLSAEKRRLLELDYQMTNGQRTLQVRAALLLYMIKRLRLDHYESNPEAQQIIIEPECQKALSIYLP